MSFYRISGNAFPIFSKILKNLNKEYALKRLISRKHKKSNIRASMGTPSVGCNKLILNILAKFLKVSCKKIAGNL